MKPLAILLGCFSVGGQVLLLRELLAAFGGDELLLGTAFSGWLIAVALGAWLGGRAGFKTGPLPLLISGAVILPLSLLAVRISPLLLTSVPGEVVAFPIAALASILLMLPLGLISGALFPTISNLAIESREAIITVYLFEGVGAFIGGLLLAFLLGSALTTLSAALLLALITFGATLLLTTKLHLAVVAPITMFACVASLWFAPAIELKLTQLRYPGYEVLDYFDTHYTQQVILQRGDTRYLVTDNLIESTYPDLEAAENLLLPGLLYNPHAASCYCVGVSDFSLATIVDSLPNLSFSVFEPREDLARHLEAVTDRRGPRPVVMSRSRILNSDSPDFDLALLNPGSLDSYLGARMLGAPILGRMKAALAVDGVVVVALPYDTERYISPATQQLLAAIYGVLRGSFEWVAVWPGPTTTFFASNANPLDLSEKELLSNLDSLPYQPLYLTDSYLHDRLEPMRRQRLDESLRGATASHSFNRPLLPHYQLAQRAEAGLVEKTLLKLATSQRIWLLLPAILILLFWFNSASSNYPRRYANWLYWLCGFVSLSLELLVFYLYQANAGALYSHLAVLIGVFMIGLAVGSYSASKSRHPALELSAMGMLVAVSLLFLLTYQFVPYEVLLLYCSLVLLATAVATGALFVAATNRRQQDLDSHNRGSGYAWELLGSGFAALLTLIWFLPALGFVKLLLALVILMLLTGFGSFLTPATRPQES